jgi:NAD(P)-dependent dehydrogenase (short-subunit alcohol dehydrogenase family)
VDKQTFLKGQISNMVPLQRIGTPEDVAGAALFFASSLSDYVTGDRILVSGGSPILPPKITSSF